MLAMELSLPTPSGKERTIGDGYEPYVIAEVGGNHDGNLHKALLAIDDAARAGADCVKFQLYKTEDLVPQSAESYPAVRGYATQFERQKDIELPRDWVPRLAERCNELGLHFSASPWDKESVDLLIEHNAPFIKVGSGDVSNIPLLRYIAEKDLPVFMSVGGASFELIGQAVQLFSSEKLILLHCPLPYPTGHENVNLKRILALREHFGVLAGYSDHTVTIDACVGAAYLGAAVIEKHVAPNKGYRCTGDHKVSAEPDELKELVKRANCAEWQRGDMTNEGLTKEARAFGVRLRRALRLTKDVGKGETITPDALDGRRSEDKGVPMTEYDNVVNKTAKRDLQQDEYLQPDDY